MLWCITLHLYVTNNQVVSIIIFPFICTVSTFSTLVVYRSDVFCLFVYPIIGYDLINDKVNQLCPLTFPFKELGAPGFGTIFFLETIVANDIR